MTDLEQRVIDLEQQLRQVTDERNRLAAEKHIMSSAVSAAQAGQGNIERREAALLQWHHEEMNLLIAERELDQLMQGVDQMILALRIGQQQRLIRRDELGATVDRMTELMSYIIRQADMLNRLSAYADVPDLVFEYQKGVTSYLNKGDGGVYLEKVALDRDPNKQRWVDYRDSLDWGGPEPQEGWRLVADEIIRRVESGEGNISQVAFDIKTELGELPADQMTKEQRAMSVTLHGVKPRRLHVRARKWVSLRRKEKPE